MMHTRMPYALALEDTLDRIVALPPARAIQQALPLVRQLAGEYAERLARGSVAAKSAVPVDGPQLVEHVAGDAASWWLGYFRWAPGATTPIHDHTSWGVYVCAGGTLLEARYRRLDDGAAPNRAHVRLDGRRLLRASGSSELLPYAGGIHRVTNPGAAPAWSVHLYGPRLGLLDGRDYDPARDTVCDRWG